MSTAETTYHRDFKVDKTYEGLLRALEEMFQRRTIHKLKVAHSQPKDKLRTLFCLCFARGKVGNLKPHISEGWQVWGQATSPYPIGEVSSVDLDRDEIWIRRLNPQNGHFEENIELRQPDFLASLRDWLRERRGRPLPSLLNLGRNEQRQILSDLPDLILDALRPSQAEALRRLGPGVHYIWGPPGTGKTHNVAWAAYALRQEGYRVALLAPTNVAVDNAVLAVHQVFQQVGAPLQGGQLVRAGYPSLPQLEHYPELMSWQAALAASTTALQNLRNLRRETTQKLKGTKGKERVALKQSLEELKEEVRLADGERAQQLWTLSAQADLLGATMYAAQHRSEMRAFLSFPKVAVIIDEAGMVPRYALLPLLELLSGGQAPQGELLNPPIEVAVVLAGDPKQLSPIYATARNEDVNSRFWLGESLMEELLDRKLDELAANGNVSVLCQQSRMHITLCRRISRTYYDGVLETLPDETRPDPPIAVGWPYDALVLLDPMTAPLPDDSPPVNNLRRAKKTNQRSLQVAVRLIRQGLAAGADSVLWLTPFRDQARLARKLCDVYFSNDNVRAGTIHTSQGAEADLVILDPVNALHRWLRGLFGKPLDIDRLLNVAASRGRGQVVVLTSRRELRKNDIFRRLLSDAVEWGG